MRLRTSSRRRWRRVAPSNDRPSTYGGPGREDRRREGDTEAGLGDVEASSPAATPIDELTAATPRPNTKLI